MGFSKFPSGGGGGGGAGEVGAAFTLITQNVTTSSVEWGWKVLDNCELADQGIKAFTGYSPVGGTTFADIFENATDAAYLAGNAYALNALMESSAYISGLIDASTELKSYRVPDANSDWDPYQNSVNIFSSEFSADDFLDIDYSADGLTAITLGTGGVLKQWSVASAFSDDPADYTETDTENVDVEGNSSISCARFNHDGTKVIFFCFSGPTVNHRGIYEASLSTAYDISSGSYALTKTSNQVARITHNDHIKITVSPNGEKMLLAGSYRADFYNLSTAHDISTLGSRNSGNTNTFRYFHSNADARWFDDNYLYVSNEQQVGVIFVPDGDAAYAAANAASKGHTLNIHPHGAGRAAFASPSTTRVFFFEENGTADMLTRMNALPSLEGE